MERLDKVLQERIETLPRPIVVDIGGTYDVALRWLDKVSEGSIISVNPRQVQPIAGKRLIMMQGDWHRTNLPEGIASEVQINMVISAGARGNREIQEALLEAKRIAAPGAKLEIIDSKDVLRLTQVLARELGLSSKIDENPSVELLEIRSDYALRFNSQESSLFTH